MDTTIKTFEPRWYQTEAVEAFKDFLRATEPGRNAIIAMPTGTGKSVVIAQIVKYICQWPENKVLMLTHVGELVKQNADKLRAVWPQGDIGICAAGLGRRDTKQAIIYSTVQTVHSLLKRNKYALGRRRLVIIDECHLLSEDENSMYRQVLAKLGELDPKMRVLGLSATPYRTKDGKLTEQENAIFTDVAYDLNKDFARLVEEGYLAPLTSVKTPVEVNLKGVHIQGGDYNSKEVQAAVGNDVLLEQACNVMVNEGRYRRSWIVFVSGIKNAVRVREMLERRGIDVRDVTSANTAADNAQAIAAFRSGQVRCLVSANQLTTGFDVPQIDLIAVLRPTVSPSLHCLDKQTEVLTAAGFKKWNEVSVGELCASVVPDTLELKYVPITGYVHRQLSSDEFMLSLKRPSLDIRVSNNHRMLVDVRRGRDHHFEREILSCSDIIDLENIRIPVSAVPCNSQSVGLSKEELIFIGFWLADGCINPANNDCYFSISDRYPQIKQEIENVMTSIGLGFRSYHWSAEQVSSHGFKTVYGATRYYISKGKLRGERSHLKGWGYLQKYLNKSLCDDLTKCSHEDFAFLLHGLDLGDGWHAEKYADGSIMHTFNIALGKNSVLAEKLQILAIKNGFRANLADNDPSCLLLRIKETNWSSVVKRSAGHVTNWQKETGTQEWVWCVENKNGTLITRRNGKVAILGNCQMLGRGTRPCPGKVDCLVLDFAHNIARLGPINDPIIKERKPKGELTEEEKQEEKEEAELLPRNCPNCGALLPPRTRSCPYCGYRAVQELDVSDLTGLTPLAYIKHTPTIPSSRVWQVSSFVAGKYQNKNTGMHMLRVRVGCTGNGADFNAHFYLNFDSLRDPVRFDAAKTWLQFGGLDPIPRTVSEAIARAKELKAPREIELIKKNWYQKRNYDELIRVYYD